MKIVHIAASLEGGAGIGLLRYHSALLKSGLNSRIVVPEGVMPIGAKSRKDVSPLAWRPHPKLERMLRRIGFRFLSSETSHEREKNRLLSAAAISSLELFSLPYSCFRPEEHPWVTEADVVAIHWTAGVLDWSRFFKKVHTPVCIVLHDQHPYLGGFHYEWDARRNPAFAVLDSAIRSLKQAAIRYHRVLVVANSEWNARAARQSGFFAKETNIETIYYPLSNSTYSPRLRPTARRDLGIAANAFVIGFACENLANDRKGFPELLAALDQISVDSSMNLVLLSFGRAPHDSDRSRFSFEWLHLGYLNDEEAKIRAYSAMDIFVTPSRAEAFGLTALEAQACGTAVVASRIDGLNEAVADNAVTEGCNDTLVARLAQGMTLLAGNSKRRASAVRDGLDLVHERHNPTKIGAQFRNALESLIS